MLGWAGWCCLPAGSFRLMVREPSSFLKFDHAFLWLVLSNTPSVVLVFGGCPLPSASLACGMWLPISEVPGLEQFSLGWLEQPSIGSLTSHYGPREGQAMPIPGYPGLEQGSLGWLFQPSLSTYHSLPTHGSDPCDQTPLFQPIVPNDQ